MPVSKNLVYLSVFFDYEQSQPRTCVDLWQRHRLLARFHFDAPADLHDGARPDTDAAASSPAEPFVPKEVTVALAGRLKELLSDDEPLWLTFELDPAAAAFAWERAFSQMSPSRTVLRLAYCARPIAAQPTTGDLVVCVTAKSASDPSHPHALTLIKSLAGDKSRRVHLFVHGRTQERFGPVQSPRSNVNVYGHAAEPSHGKRWGNAWLDWMSAALPSDRAVDTVHFVTEGAILHQQGVMLVPSCTTGSGEAEWMDPLGADQLQPFLIELGACGVGFSHNRSNDSEVGLQKLVDALTRQRPVFGFRVGFDAAPADVDWRGIYALVLDERGRPPVGGEASIYCQPSVPRPDGFRAAWGGLFNKLARRTGQTPTDRASTTTWRVMEQRLAKSFVDTQQAADASAMPSPDRIVKLFRAVADRAVPKLVEKAWPLLDKAESLGRSSGHDSADAVASGEIAEAFAHAIDAVREAVGVHNGGENDAQVERFWNAVLTHHALAVNEDLVAVLGRNAAQTQQGERLVDALTRTRLTVESEPTADHLTAWAESFRQLARALDRPLATEPRPVPAQSDGIAAKPANSPARVVERPSAGRLRGGGRFDRRNPLRDDGIESSLVKIYRCAKVVKGGRTFSFGALVIAGDRAGNVGLGYGKANEVPMAVEKATKDARRSMVKVPLKGTTIPHTVKGKHGSSAVTLVPARPGTGVTAGKSVRPCLELAGITDIFTKAYGSTSPKNLVKATIDALKRLQTREEVERDRKIKIEGISAMFGVES